MNKTKVFIALLIFVSGQLSLGAMDYPELSPAPYIDPISDIHDPAIKEEDPLRRAEIIFFISFPFVLIAQYALFFTLSYVNEPVKDYSLNNISPGTSAYLFTSTALASGAIAWADYERRRKLMETDHSLAPREASFRVQLDHKF